MLKMGCGMCEQVARLGAGMATAGRQPLSSPPQPSTSGSIAGGADVGMLPASSGVLAPSLVDDQDRLAVSCAWHHVHLHPEVQMEIKLLPATWHCMNGMCWIGIHSEDEAVVAPLNGREIHGEGVI